MDMKSLYTELKKTNGKNYVRIFTSYSINSISSNVVQGKDFPLLNNSKKNLQQDIMTIIKCNSQSKIITDHLLPLWGGHEISLDLVGTVHTADEEISEILNNAGKSTLIFKKKLRQNYIFPIISEEALILVKTEDENYGKFTLNLFKNPPVKIIRQPLPP